MFKRSALYLALTSSFAFTQQAIAVEQDEQVKGIERIQVTGSRRASSVQEAPLNITALDADIMKDQNITELSDVARWVPGLTIPDQGGYYGSPIIVRGLNTNASNPGSDGNTVATYVGDVPLAQEMKILDVERVEVLIGPQGTLYGAGTLGGAIRYIPKKPVLDETSGSIYGDLFSVAASDDQGGEVGFVFNQPLINDKLGLRVAFNYLDDPGFIDYNYLVKKSGVSLPDPDWSDSAAVSENLSRKKDINFDQTTTARASLRWQAADNVDINLAYHYQKQELGGRSISHFNSLSVDNPLATQMGKYDGAYRFVEPRENETSLLSLELVADLGFAELTSATGKSDYETDYQRDQTDLLIRLDYSYEDFPAFSAFTRDLEASENFTQEIRLVSQNNSPLSWIVGGYYSNFEYTSDSREFTPGYGEFAAPDGEGIDYRADSLEYIAILREKTIEKALFGELTYQVNEQLAFTVGSRFYEYQSSYLADSSAPLFNVDFMLSELQLSGENVEDDGSLFKFNVNYQFSSDVLTYATISEGFRIGGSNGIDLCPDPIPEGQKPCALPHEFGFSPDNTTNYELGFKSTWQQNRLHFNAAIFLVEWQDAQVQGATVNGQEPFTSNAATAASTGVEIATRAIINDKLSAYATYAYTNVELTSDAPALYGTYDVMGSEIQNFYDGNKGDRLPGSPENQFSFGLTYSTEVFDDKLLDINYGLTYQSDVITKVGLKADGEVLPGFALSNLSAKLSDDAWSLTFYIDNLFDKYAVTSVRRDKGDIGQAKFSELNINGQEMQRNYGHYVVTPRTIGLRVNYNFDM
ncbi:MAG: TonB-dependent receptor [Thalassotalea sp.]